MRNMTRAIALTVTVILLVIGLPLSYQMWEELDAGEVMVVQSVTGSLTIHSTPGPKWQGFGKVTKYRLRDKLWFIDPSSKRNIPKDAEGQPALEIRFNEGGRARVNGSIDYEIPTDTESILKIHSRYRTQEALESGAIRQAVAKSIYMAGPLMSPTEAYASRRNELLSIVADQVANGVYKTSSKEIRVTDEITGEEKVIVQAKVVADNDGKPLREEQSMLNELGVKTYNLAIEDLDFEDRVEQQIRKQQESAAAAAQAVIEARTADQKKNTAKSEAAAVQAKLEGEAEAKKAEAVVNAKRELEVAAIEALKQKTNAVIQAEQKLRVAELAAQEAEQFKKAEELKGQGEAARRKAVLEADGALEKKLEAWIEVNKAYADALTKYNGAIVPSVVLGGNSGTGQSAGFDGFQQMLQLLGVKAARDLALDMSMTNSVKK